MLAMLSALKRRRQFLTGGVFALATGRVIGQLRPSAKAAKVAIAEAALKPDKIEAKDIVSGNPRAGDLVFSTSADGRETRGVWSCTRGSFHWTFDTDETAVILQGRVTVQMEDGAILDLRPGDLAVFPRGQKSVWTIVEDLRKAYVLYR
jgi:uncharacterized protein